MRFQSVKTIFVYKILNDRNILNLYILSFI